MEKSERTHVYIGRCPDCEAALTMISVVADDDPAWVALEVGKAIMRGLVVDVMTDLDFRDQRPQMGSCDCKGRMIRQMPSCAYCGGTIYQDGVEYANYMQGNLAVCHLHRDCQRHMDEEDFRIMSWGEGERPDSPEKEADRARAARAEAVLRGQLELPL